MALSLGAVTGLALQLLQASLWSTTHYGAMLLLGGVITSAGVFCCKRTPFVFSTGSPRGGLLLCIFLLAGALAGAGSSGWRAAQFASRALPLDLQGVDIEVTGHIASLPQRTPQGERFLLAVDSGHYRGQPVALPEQLQLGWYGGGETVSWARGAGSPGLRTGEHWRFTVRLRSPHGNANPHGFDLERWLWTRRIGATGYVRNGPRDPAPEKLAATAGYPLQAARQQVRDAIHAHVQDPRAAGVIAALLVGDQSSVDRADWALFRTTGVAHLMVISGLHVTLFAWMAMALMAWLWPRLGRQWPVLLLSVPTPVASAWGGLLLAAGYALFSGWGLPAQRAVVMLAVVMVLRLGARRWPWPLVWWCAMLAVLLIDPMAWLQPGFWLSFVAVGVLFASGRHEPGLQSSDDEVPPSTARRGAIRLVQGFIDMVRTQAVVTVALAPLTLLLFGQFSVASLVANLVAIPVVTQLVMPLVLLGAVFAPLWDAAAWLIQVLSWLLGWLAQWPWAAVHRPAAPTGLALAGVLGGLLLVLRLPWTLRSAGVLLLWPVLLWSPPRPAVGAFEMIALDVGQGSAVLIRTANHSLLYDTGPRYSPDSDAGDRIVVPMLRALGERLDSVVVSHIDSDHSGGNDAVQADHPQARWLSSYDNDIERRCLAGQQWEWDDVRFEVLHPHPHHFDENGKGRLSTNDMSCVLLVSAGEQSAWLGGDITDRQEVRMALDRPELRATVMLAPHHGSRSSSSPVLLNTLRPRWVIVQAGYRNRFNHPAPIVLDRYRQREIPWVTSASCGAAIWRSWQPETMRCHRQAQRRFWHHPGDLDHEPRPD
ncbi:MAG: DNA internalization-related competence protein ComEC/Rec2 [Comamonadaceae bacterium]|nr:DNA internalization-related competence protein ComEC/Rec2 [Comamonadaceae bacterium]